MKFIKNNNYTIEITGMTTEASGVGKIEGFAIFVPNTVVGDYCEIKLIKVKKSYGYGKLVKIMRPSKDRIDIDCPHFLQCGGCAYRHINYDAELKIKHDFVIDSFKRIGKLDVNISDIIGCENTARYRNKAQYPVAVNNKIENSNNIMSGFYARNSHRVIDVKDCLLQPTLFNDIQKEILDFLYNNQISIYNELDNSGLIRHIYIRNSDTTNSVMLCLVTTSFKIPKIDLLVEEITKKFPQITSIIINKNSEKTNVILGQDCKVIYGDEYITDILFNKKINISPLSFYQVNRKQVDVLYSKAIELAALNKDDILLDLYCGVGTIGLVCSDKVKELIGVEIIPQAIENAKENAKINDIKNTKFICNDATSACQDFIKQKIKPSVIIVDPPRKGLDNDGINAISILKPQRLVMISCNPVTAARDCALLSDVGYLVEEIIPVDMFPRTTHVEIVLSLRLREV